MNKSPLHFNARWNDIRSVSVDGSFRKDVVKRCVVADGVGSGTTSRIELEDGSIAEKDKFACCSAVPPGVYCLIEQRRWDGDKFVGEQSELLANIICIHKQLTPRSPIASCTLLKPEGPDYS
jgi:hypothetical protein